MAFKKASQPISKSSIPSKKRCNGASSFNICAMASVLLELAFLQLIASLLILPSPSEAFYREPKRVKVTNNHTNILTVRCFSFYESETTERRHLKPKEWFNFTVEPNKLFPSMSMYNCSTNMGVFVAYSYDYECATEDYPTCDWRFDENRTYHFIHKTNTWVAYDYNPNYESLGRGGVVRGFFTN